MFEMLEIIVLHYRIMYILIFLENHNHQQLIHLLNHQILVLNSYSQNLLRDTVDIFYQNYQQQMLDHLISNHFRFQMLMKNSLEANYHLQGASSLILTGIVLSKNKFFK